MIDAKNKRVATPPKPTKQDDAVKAKQALDRYKALKKDVRTLAAALIARYEASMRDRVRWTQAELGVNLIAHPLAVHLVRRLVWGVYGEGGELLTSFRVDESGRPASVTDAELDLPEGGVGIAHPTELGDDLRPWSELFASYKILQPFPQLGRPVLLPDSDASRQLLQQLDGARVAAGRVVGLMQHGWQRGTMEDHGTYFSLDCSRGGLEARVHVKEGLDVMGSDLAADKTVSVKLSGQCAAVDYSEVLYALSKLLD